MGLYVQNNEDRSELQQRIAAELREKAARVQETSGKSTHDDIEGTAYMKGTKKAGDLGWLWVLLAIIIAGVIIFLFMNQMK